LALLVAAVLALALALPFAFALAPGFSFSSPEGLVLGVQGLAKAGAVYYIMRYHMFELYNNLHPGFDNNYESKSIKIVEPTMVLGACLARTSNDIESAALVKRK